MNECSYVYMVTLMIVSKKVASIFIFSMMTLISLNIYLLLNIIPKKQTKLSAEELTIVDKSGCSRIRLTVDGSNQPTFELSDNKKNLISTMSIDSNGDPYIGFGDSKGRIRLRLGLSHDDTYLEIFDTKTIDDFDEGKELFNLKITESGESWLLLKNRNSPHQLAISNSNSGIFINFNNILKILSNFSDKEKSFLILDGQNKIIYDHQTESGAKIEKE